ncbi:hypothetical protein QP140_09315 [Corynebacterium sp. UMB9976]|uniref:DUF1049 domain-containing protein n=1 Tax=Corynebacterium urealyticum TaxID=43771 RepID=A0A2W5CV44_9CORY|nr:MULTISPECIES: hypothetical protein [unclassified Corynebacterium]MDK6302776.1 hypothetical protein [Corynebacterium sp. UMB9976]MDK8790851.1 hypothetical protein [Corynebacterium sp. MSK039]PZO98835.1 MAG: hypothetical protein DI609_09665 [Corynebacterium urealyticum]
MKKLLALRLLSVASILVLLVMLFWPPPALNDMPQLQANVLMALILLFAVGSTTAMGFASYKEAKRKRNHPER